MKLLAGTGRGRYLVSPEAVEFLGWVLRLPTAAFAFRGRVDTPDRPLLRAPDRTGDTVAHREDSAAHGVSWVVAIEFRTQPDPTMYGRLLGYPSGLRLSRKADDARPPLRSR